MNFTSCPGRGLNRLVLAASLAIASPAFSAIVFSNPTLEGTPATQTAVPTGWEFVPYDAPFNLATTAALSTGDVLAADGPAIGSGLFGAAQSGDTFFAGIHGSTTPQVLQEGLQQTVSGFTVGEDYSFSFFQANVGHTNRQDSEGSWRVYADGVLIGTTDPTTRTLAWNDPDKATDLNWEERTVTFTATSESMTLSFLPYDGDGDVAGQGGVYMGIDSFSEITPVPEPAAALLGAFGFLGLMRRRR
ncbi:PEP-CTERM sorting domain-containing protein [Luteolibacter luteus]|uniref:PEP-CTERM sorting domain-containing protein n=1 Tax=Luteolibacter luteus TaxID=2728835 RepID=A0A858RQC2_9BACT|nr:PEP-CTERM sorting domain-containing protein [Luteolibacter luteus]QJE99092.1 PEP-CTERM sorting domain-containing protein [Luteolibacter luteus]